MYEVSNVLRLYNLEATAGSIEAKISEKEKEIQLLHERDSMNTDAIASLSDQLAKIMGAKETTDVRKNSYQTEIFNTQSIRFGINKAL
jgi:hypothetical protein